MPRMDASNGGKLTTTTEVVGVVEAALPATITASTTTTTTTAVATMHNGRYDKCAPPDDDDIKVHRHPRRLQRHHLDHYRRLLSQDVDLLQWKDMPRHLQFNPYIYTGYRPLLTFWGCITSLFYWHNETINILTHAIPILYILLTVPPLMPWTQMRFLSWCHVAGLVAPWVGSFLYHLFMNLDKGEKIYCRLLQIDMLGIWITQSFGALPMIVATTFCFPTVIRWAFIGSYVLLSGWGLYKAMTAWSPWERRLCFLLPFVIRVILCFTRYSSIGGGDPGAFTHVILQDLVSVIGAAIGAMHIPEKWFPGCLDLYLNSHNIMHVLVVAAVYSMHVATVRDLQWMMTRAADCSAADVPPIVQPL